MFFSTELSLCRVVAVGIIGYQFMYCFIKLMSYKSGDWKRMYRICLLLDLNYSSNDSVDVRCYSQILCCAIVKNSKRERDTSIIQYDIRLNFDIDPDWFKWIYLLNLIGGRLYEIFPAFLKNTVSSQSLKQLLYRQKKMNG